MRSRRPLSMSSRRHQRRAAYHVQFAHPRVAPRRHRIVARHLNVLRATLIGITLTPYPHPLPLHPLSRIYTCEYIHGPSRTLDLDKKVSDSVPNACIIILLLDNIYGHLLGISWRQLFAIVTLPTLTHEFHLLPHPHSLDAFDRRTCCCAVSIYMWCERAESEFYGSTPKRKCRAVIVLCFVFRDGKDPRVYARRVINLQMAFLAG